MQSTEKVAQKMGIIPRLRLGSRLPKGGVKSNGPHVVKLISDKLVEGKDPMTGQARQEICYIVEERGKQYQWHVPLYNKKKEPHYLIERLMSFKEGDEVVLEMMKAGINNYVDVRAVEKAGHSDELPTIEQGEEAPE